MSSMTRWAATSSTARPNASRSRVGWWWSVLRRGECKQSPPIISWSRTTRCSGCIGLYRQRAPQLVHECTRKLLELYAEGKIRPHIGRQAPLEDAVTLLQAVASRQTTGKAVLTV